MKDVAIVIQNSKWNPHSFMEQCMLAMAWELQYQWQPLSSLFSF